MREKVHKIFVPLICGLAVLALIGFFAREVLKVAKIPKIEKVEEKVREEIPPAKYGLASGKQVYERITDKPRDPQIIEIEVDPLDVEIGKTQVVTVKVKTKADSVRAEDYVLGTAILDGKTTDFPLKLKKAEGKEELITTWQGKWERKFPIEKHYQIRIFVKNIKGEDEAILSFGSACPGVLPGGDYTVATSCTFAYNVDGVDNGNLIIAGPETCAPSGCQLTINAGQTIVWNPGKSVYVNGSIWINKPGGQLKKTYLWMIDADADNYPANTAQYYGGTADTPPAGCSNCKRRYLMATTTATDCLDSTSTKYQYLTCYVDGDGDGYGAGTASNQCCGSACGQGCTGYSATSTDCCDTDANAKPGQTQYFATPRSGCGGYDYDCDNATTTYFPSNCITNLPTAGCYNGLSNPYTRGFVSSVPSCGATGTLRMVYFYNAGDCNADYFARCTIVGTSPTAYCGTCSVSFLSVDISEEIFTQPCR
jgi:hypothetical protein